LDGTRWGRLCLVIRTGPTSPTIPSTRTQGRPTDPEVAGPRQCRIAAGRFSDEKQTYSKGLGTPIHLRNVGIIPAPGRMVPPPTLPNPQPASALYLDDGAHPGLHSWARGPSANSFTLCSPLQTSRNLVPFFVLSFGTGRCKLTLKIRPGDDDANCMTLDALALRRGGRRGS
jgi:hypothetical protein